MKIRENAALTSGAIASVPLRIDLLLAAIRNTLESRQLDRAIKRAVSVGIGEETNIFECNDWPGLSSRPNVLITAIGRAARNQPAIFLRPERRLWSGIKIAPSSGPAAIISPAAVNSAVHVINMHEKAAPCRFTDTAQTARVFTVLIKPDRMLPRRLHRV